MSNLKTCHPDLQRLFLAVIQYRDCSILCGHRTEAEQNAAYAVGNSRAKWGKSKHNTSPSKAVDVMPYPIDWQNKEGMFVFAGFVLGMAACMNIKIKWGGDFSGFFDGPHYELIGV